MSNPPGSDRASYQAGYDNHSGFGMNSSSYNLGQDDRAREVRASQAASAGGYGGSASFDEGAGGFVKWFLLAPLKVIFIIPATCVALCILYPMAITGAVAASVGAWRLGRVLLPRSRPDWQLGGMLFMGLISGLVVFYIFMLTEQRLGGYRVYRYPRHLVRLTLFAALITFIALGWDWALVDMSIVELGRKLWSLPLHLTAIGIALLIAHLVLIYHQGARDYWHAALEGFTLRRGES